MAQNRQQIIQDARFQEILSLEGIELQQFYEERPAANMFVDAQSYPDFFSQNLVSPNRILKILSNNPQSNMRIFYFQILRLGYQIELENDINKNVILNFRRIVFHPEFEILFTQQTEEQRDLFNDFQFKKLFAQFIVFLDKQQYPNIEQILYHYPIMDTVFIHILRSLLASQNINEQFDIKIPSEVVFGELSLLFQLNITSYGNCWKFEDSDMFCYQQNEDELYMAYIVQEGQVDGQQTNQFDQPNEQKVQIDYLKYPINSTIKDNNKNTSNLNSYFEDPQSQDQNINIHQPLQIPIVQQNRTTQNKINQNYAINAVQKLKLPKQAGEPSLFKNYDGFLSKVQNTIKSSFSYNQPVPDSITNTNTYQPFSYESRNNKDYKSTEYISNSNYNPIPSYNPTHSNYTSNYTNNYNTYSNPYQNSYSNTYSNSYGNNNLYDKYGSSSTYNTYSSSSYNTYSPSYTPVQNIPYTVYKPEIVPAFKPVQPTPLPKFDEYKPYQQPKRTHQSTYQSSYSHNQPTYVPSSTYNTGYQDKYYEKVYKPTPTISYNTDGTGDYYKDFTPPDILSKLRVENRDNISKIKQSMKGVTRGGQIPSSLNLKRSAIYTNDEVEPKRDLYRNQSRSQFEYPQIYKTVSSKPIDYNDINYYSSSKTYSFEPNNYYQSSYSQVSY